MSASDFFSRSRQLPVWAGLLLAVLFVAGCGAPPKPAPSAKRPRPLPSISQAQGWTGTYRGIAPCTQPSSATCLSQQLVLTLLPGDTYELETTVQRQGKPYTITSKGRFTWDATRTIITLASKDENTRLRLGPGTAERLPGINDDVDYHGYVLRKR